MQQQLRRRPRINTGLRQRPRGRIVTSTIGERPVFDGDIEWDPRVGSESGVGGRVQGRRIGSRTDLLARRGLEIEAFGGGEGGRGGVEGKDNEGMGGGSDSGVGSLVGEDGRGGGGGEGEIEARPESLTGEEREGKVRLGFF